MLPVKAVPPAAMVSNEPEWLAAGIGEKTARGAVQHTQGVG
ncbi:MAG TPA: hypothetical protein VGJ60_27605 [Chloroflexota bacterium]